MIITVTEKGTWLRCRQQWEWGSFNGYAYQTIIAKPALGIGRLWHATQAEWSLHPNDDPNNLLLGLANEEIERIKREYFERIGAPISQAELDQTIEGIGMVISMVKNYKDHWGSPLPDGFEMMSPEQTCVVPIPGTEHNCTTCGGKGWVVPLPLNPCNECKGSGKSMHYIAGTLDGLIRDKYGSLYVLERKTYGQRPKPEVLNMQDQFLAYLWILNQLNIGEVGGLAYDGVWKRKEPPKGSTLADLFLRIRLRRNRYEMQAYGEQLRAIVNEMADNPAIYVNRRWDGCWDCDYIEPCIAKMRGEDWEAIFNNRFTRRPKEEDSTRELKHADA